MIDRAGPKVAMSPQSQPGSEPSLDVPLSIRLGELLVQEGESSRMSLNRILQRTGGRGIYLVIVFLCLPFVVPVSLPGLSSFIGLVVGILSVGLALGKPPMLPRWLGERELKPKTMHRILEGSVRLLRFLEKLVRPRRTQWLARPSAMLVNGALMTFMALVLALPFPPIVLFTNSLPSYAIILIALSIMEEDGLTIWLGYAAVLLTLLYFVLMGGVLLPHVIGWIEVLISWLRGGG